MPLKKFSAVVAFVTVLSGCTASKLDQDAQVRVSGTVLDAAGRPASGADVGLFKVADIGEVLVGATLAVGTLGVSCFVEDGPSFCKGARKAKTKADGTFSFELTGRDTQGSVANANDFDLTARVRRDGAPDHVASVRFKIQREELEIPPLRMWDAAADVTSDGVLVRTNWPALPSDYGGSASYSVRFADSDQGRIVWNIPNAQPGARLDTRYLEDRTGTVEVAASRSAPGPDTTFRFTHFARGAGFKGAGKPPSRGAACSATTADGQAAALEPCRASDGDLYAPSGAGSGGTVRTGVYLDLGRSKALQLVVARGAPGTTTVETSDDAKTWTALGQGSGTLVSVDGRSVGARYVRVRTTNNVDISNLSEIAVW